jgi:hypothetical protein
MKFVAVPLTEKIRVATQGTGPFYSIAFRDHCHEYHATGASWSQTQLERFFQDGLLQHYIGEISGINLGRESFYRRNPSEFYDNIYHKNPAWIPVELQSRILEKDDKRFVKVVIQLILKIKTLPILMKKGGDFQRLKQFNEVYGKKIDANAATGNFLDNVSLMKKALINDKEMDALQYEIYNWVNHFYVEVHNFICSEQFDWVDLERNVDKFKPLVNLYPEREVISQEAEIISTEKKALELPVSIAESALPVTHEIITTTSDEQSSTERAALALLVSSEESTLLAAHHEKKMNAMFLFAIQHPKLTAGLAGLCIASLIVASVLSCGAVAGVAAVIGASIGLSGGYAIAAGTAVGALGAGLIVGGATFFAVRGRNHTTPNVPENSGPAVEIL